MDAQKKSKGSFRKATETPDLRHNEALTQYIQDNYTKPPPELSEFFPDIPHLSKLAELIHNLFSTASEKPLSRESAELCELGTRHLINEYKTMKEEAMQADTSLGKAKKLVDYAALLAQNPSDITLAKLQILELQRENQELTNKINECRNELQSTQDEYDKIYSELSKKKIEIQRQANNHNNEISKMKYEYAQLENARQAAIDQSKLDEENIARLKKQVNQIKDEADASAKEIEALRERLKQKNDMITKLRTEIKKRQIEHEEFKLQKEHEDMTMSSEFLTQSRAIEDKNNAALRKLSRHIAAQHKEIEMLKDANYKATEVLEKQNLLLDKYEEELAHVHDGTESLSEQLLSQRELNEHLQEELSAAQSQLQQQSDELTNLREIVEKSCSNLLPTYVVTPDQLPDVCHELAGTRIDAETAKNLQRLNAIADGLSQFIIKLIRDGTADLEFLKEEPIKIKQPTRSDIYSQVEEIRIFLDGICYSSAEEDKIVSYLLNPEEKYNFDEEYDSSLCAVLTTVLTRFREFLQEMVSKLNPVRDVLPAFDCKDYELPGAVAEYIIQLQPVFQQLLQVIGNTLHFHGDITDIFACLCKYIEESSSVLNQLDDDCRPLINYSGKIVDIVPHITDILKEYKEIVDNQDVVNKRELTESLIAADRDRAQYERQIDDLNDTIVKKERLNASLQKQLEKVAADLQEAQNQIEDLTEGKIESDKTNENLSMQNQANKEAIVLLQQQNARLEATLKDRTASFERRLQEAIEKERQLTSESNEREAKRFQEQQELLEKQITELNKKLQEEKANVSNTVQLYNQQSIEHQEELRRLRQEKQELSVTIEHLKEAPEENKIIDELHQKLADAKMKNRELIAEVNRLNGNAPNPSVTNSIYSSRGPSSPRSRNASGMLTPQQYSQADASSIASSRSPSPVREETQFIDQLGSLLRSFVQKDIVWTRQRILKTVDALLQRLDLLEKNKVTGGKHSEWSQWADELLKHVKPKYIGGITDAEMRQQIGDLTIAAGNRTKLIDMIQILRDEKQALSKFVELQKSEPPAHMRAFALVGLFASTVNKNLKHDAPQTRSIRTPASPAAVKSTISMLK